MRDKIRGFSFTKNFKFISIIAALFVIVGLVGLLLLPFGVQLFNFDIDFVGGTTMQFDWALLRPLPCSPVSAARV